MQAAVDVLLGDRNHQAQVGLGHFALGLARAAFAGDHLLVDGAQFGQRNAGLFFQFDQAGLVFADRMNLPFQRGAMGIGAIDFALHPVEVGFAAREGLDEALARHAALVDCHIQHLPFQLAQALHLLAQQVAQVFHGFRTEAHAEKFLGDGCLGGAAGFAGLAAGSLHGGETGWR